MKRLNESEELAAYTSQFVTVKMATNTPEWRQFHKDFKGSHTGSVSIPFVDVVRSDGESKKQCAAKMIFANCRRAWRQFEKPNRLNPNPPSNARSKKFKQLSISEKRVPWWTKPAGRLRVCVRQSRNDELHRFCGAGVSLAKVQPRRSHMIVEDLDDLPVG